MQKAPCPKHKYELLYVTFEHFACADGRNRSSNLLLVCRSVSTADNQEGLLEGNLRRTAVVYQGEINNTVPFLKSGIKKMQMLRRIGSNGKESICKVERT